MPRTKIVCTIGPASRDPELLERLVLAGMNVARLNFSHGEREAKLRIIEDLRAVSARLSRPVAVLQDLAGPKVRIGRFANGPVELHPGQTFTLTARDVPGDDREVSLVYRDLPRDVKPGDTLLLADGSLDLSVTSVEGEDVVCRVNVGGELGSNKGINLPGGTVSAPILDAKDVADLRFGLEHGVDFVALSFVRNGADVRACLAVMDEAGRRAPLIAKIEQREAIANIEEILSLVDGIMVARGDLGVEIPMERVPAIQKSLIARANAAGKPVITATQMLKTMVDSPSPTRAEVSDVANAILDGSDAVMLSEETAVGAHPVVAVETMARIAAATEADFPYRGWSARFGAAQRLSSDEAVARAAVQMTEEIGAAAIVTLTRSGSTTQLVAKHRPRQPILAMTDKAGTWRRLSLVWGAEPMMAGAHDDLDELEGDAVRLAVESGHCRPGQKVVVTAGLPLHRTGHTNVIKIVDIPLDG
jgi:pyruvate kinase